MMYFSRRCNEWFEYETVEWWMINYSRQHRYPKTTQESRQNIADTYDKNFYGFKLRGRRSKAMLPSAYDDLMNSRKCCKSWKDLYKIKKQWKKQKGKQNDEI